MEPCSSPGSQTKVFTWTEAVWNCTEQGPSNSEYDAWSLPLNFDPSLTRNYIILKLKRYKLLQSNSSKFESIFFETGLHGPFLGGGWAALESIQFILWSTSDHQHCKVEGGVCKVCWSKVGTQYAWLQGWRWQWASRPPSNKRLHFPFILLHSPSVLKCLRSCTKHSWVNAPLHWAMKCALKGTEIDVWLHLQIIPLERKCLHGTQTCQQHNAGTKCSREKSF